MDTILEAKNTISEVKTVSNSSLWRRFINWADKQEENRFGWTAFSITGHGCVFTLITVMMIIFTGNHFILWPFALGSMVACLIVNLGAMPTKITIPVLFFSIVVDLVIILFCITYYGFGNAGAYA